MSKRKIKMAVVGHGFVGSAVDYGFPDSNCNKTIIDPKYGTKVSDLADDIELAFVCVADGLTTTEAQTLRAINLTFQTALNRNV